MHDTLRAALLIAFSVSALGCVTVRPEQRAILADRIMQFGADARERAALEHALDVLELLAHRPTSSRRIGAMRWSALRVRVFTVPSGSSSCCAISLWARPLK